MCSPIQDIFVLILRVSFDFSPITIDKSSRVSYAWTKKDLELLPSNRDCALSLMFLLILLQTEVDAVMQERCCKENMVGALSSGGSKMILTLLAKVIVFHVGLITIDVR